MTLAKSHTQIDSLDPHYRDMPIEKGQTEAVWQAIMPNAPHMLQDDVNVVLTLKIRATKGGGVYAYLHGTTSDNLPLNGRGIASANSGGYHKESHAAFEAMTRAGVRFNGYWDGMGESAIHSAMLNMAQAMGHAGARVQRIWVG